MLESLVLPTTVTAAAASLVLRRAGRDDLHPLMQLLSDDPISASRGDVAADADVSAYREALARIIGDHANEIVLAVDDAGSPIGTLQLTLIPGMARRGATRLLVEAVRVKSTERSAGVGSALMNWVTTVAAPALGADLVQLTSDSTRRDAHRFYERLGFVASHTGFKFGVRDQPSATGPA